MRRGRIFIYLALVLIVVLAAVLLLPKFLGGGAGTPSQEPTPSPTPETVMIEVVAIVQNVQRGVPLTADVLQKIPINENTFVEGMFTATESLIGRRVKFDLVPGTLLTSEMLFDEAQLSTTGSDWALLIPRGMVAVSIPVSRLASVSYAPRRGDHVNVISTMMFVDLDSVYQSELPNQTALIIAPGPQGEPGKSPVALTGYYGGPSGSSPLGRVEIEPQFGEEGAPFYVLPSGPQRPRLVSQTLIQNVMVLQIGNFPLETEEKLKAAETTEVVSPTVETGTPPTGEVAAVTPTPVPVPPPPDVITLVVSPQDAITLNYLIYSGGEITLVLRATNDDTLVQTEAVTLQFLLDQYGIPVPVKLPFGMQPALTELVPPVLPNDSPTPTPVP